LAWALPSLGLASPGFRRVRGQVCKRVQRRLRQLRIPDLAGYRRYVEAHADEWPFVDDCCRVTISRFYRDGPVFDALANEVLPALAEYARKAQRRVLRVWSAGCASGEEPYTVALLWHFALAPKFGDISLAVVATDTDERVLARAEAAVYPAGCLRELPQPWRERAFVVEGQSLCLRPEHRANVTFLHQDLRSAAPEGIFDLVLCRNLAFSYFDERARRGALARLAAALAPGGALVVGLRERLPADCPAVEPWIGELGIYRRRRGRAYG